MKTPRVPPLPPRMRVPGDPSQVGRRTRSSREPPDFQATRDAYDQEFPPGMDSNPSQVTITGLAPTVVVSDINAQVGTAVAVSLTGVISTGETGDVGKVQTEPDQALLFGDEARVTAWLPDPGARKLCMKRVADENADLQVAFYQGRTKVIAWRRLCLWVWIATLFVKTSLTPVARAIAKIPALIWAVAAWLLR